jgi:hypothetical protein
MIGKRSIVKEEGKRYMSEVYVIVRNVICPLIFQKNVTSVNTVEVFNVLNAMDISV